MAKNSKTKTAKNRVKIGNLSTTKTELTGKEMKKVKGGMEVGVSINSLQAPAVGQGIQINKPKV